MPQRPPRQRLSSNALLVINARIVGKPEVIQKGPLGSCRTLQHKEFKLALSGLFPHPCVDFDIAADLP
jgi:hypothetical protein